jgi:hypothetical protein
MHSACQTLRQWALPMHGQLPLLAKCCGHPHCWILLSSSGHDDIPPFCRLLPADVALPQGGSLPKPDGQASDEEQGAVLEALRSAVLAVAELLVPDAAQRTKLLAGGLSVLLEGGISGL